MMVQMNNDKERKHMQRDDTGCRNDWVTPSGRGRMDDLRHFTGGDEERGWERQRYNERDRNRDWRCDQTAQGIETGIVAATETERTRKRGGPASHLIMSMN
jgi:hypothetical protein